MLFSSLVFLVRFVPVLLPIYFLVPGTRAKNAVLLLFSLLFYAWGEPSFVAVMLGEILVAWFLAFPIDRHRGEPKSRHALIATAAVCLGTLFWFKYANFLADSLAALTGMRLGLAHIALPAGISFYTFQILSYSVDLYRGRTRLQPDLIDFACYVALFPQLIAGPIVRYSDISGQLSKREHSLEMASCGVVRFCVGLAKKLFLANLFAQLVETMAASLDGSVLGAWLSLAAFGMQLYFDFSGYSDMAIGLGKIFGFDFAENFNYPYTAVSITDFWRRWHISLSAWFRDYVYIPMGGNRVKPSRHILNILTVWALTGLWHGAAWNFVLWGLYYALVLIAEKHFMSKALSRLPKLPKLLCHAYVLLVAGISYTIFRADSVISIKSELARLFFLSGAPFVSVESLYCLRSYGLLFCIASVAATPAGRDFARKHLAGRLGGLLEPVLVGAVLLFALAFLVDGSFNPFIYFRF